MASRGPHTCSIVPPYLLRAIAESSVNSDHHRECARRSLVLRDAITACRKERLAALTAPRGQKHTTVPQGIVPDFLLKQIIESSDVDEDTKCRARSELDDVLRIIGSYQVQQGIASASEQHTLTKKPKPKPKPTPVHFWRGVYDAKHDENEADLPGTAIRIEGQPACEDEAVNQAFDNVGKVLDFYLAIFNWRSIDNKNMHVLSSVHFASDYENACKSGCLLSYLSTSARSLVIVPEIPSS
jgi:hypothetical protein